MKNLVFLLAFLLCVPCFAGAEKNMDINGSFEKCRANAKGFVTPEGWVMNKISKGVKYSATTEEVRSGKFSFYVEASEKAVAYIYYNTTNLKAAAGDDFILTVYGKGEGKFNLGFTVYSDDAKPVFVRTIGGKPQKITDGEKWQKFVFTCPLRKLKRGGKEYTKFQLRPTLMISGAGEFVLDDLTCEKKGGKQ